MPEISWQEFVKYKTEFPMIDVRSSLEFEKGHIPTAHNIPLLNDGERVMVGTDYKQKGKQEAIKTGFRLVGPRLETIITKAEKIAQHKELLVYCWRGGMRSSSFCQFLEMAGIKTYRLEGGYKNYRIHAFECFKFSFRFIILSGYTGSGKSDLLKELDRKAEQVIDLEGIANHKGSVFGGLGMPQQPTTEQFQNILFEKILTFELSKPIWIEDESMAIGKIFLPEDFWKSMRKSPIILCQLNKKTRIKRLVQEYGAIEASVFYTAMTKITKKLGGQKFKEAAELLAQQDMPGVMEILLTYYDKAYLSSLEKRSPEKWYTLNWDEKKMYAAADELIESIQLKRS